MTHLHPHTDSTEIAMHIRRPETPEQEEARMQGVVDLARRMSQIDANLERGHAREPERISRLSWMWIALCGVIMAAFGYVLGAM